MTRFDIDTRSAVPAYQQVMQAIKLEIMSGRLKHGDQLPSIRDLAKLLKLNPNIVAKAYYNLEAEGFIESRMGRLEAFRKTCEHAFIDMDLNEIIKAFLGGCYDKERIS